MKPHPELIRLLFETPNPDIKLINCYLTILLRPTFEVIPAHASIRDTAPNTLNPGRYPPLPFLDDPSNLAYVLKLQPRHIFWRSHEMTHGTKDGGDTFHVRRHTVTVTDANTAINYVGAAKSLGFAYTRALIKALNV